MTANGQPPFVRFPKPLYDVALRAGFSATHWGVFLVIVRLTIGVRPNFAVGVNCDVAIETHPAMSGSIVTRGETQGADRCAPLLGGAGKERFVYSARDALATVRAIKMHAAESETLEALIGPYRSRRAAAPSSPISASGSLRCTARWSAGQGARALRGSPSSTPRSIRPIGRGPAARLRKAISLNRVFPEHDGLDHGPGAQPALEP